MHYESIYIVFSRQNNDFDSTLADCYLSAYRRYMVDMAGRFSILCHYCPNSMFVYNSIPLSAQ